MPRPRCSIPMVKFPMVTFWCFECKTRIVAHSPAKAKGYNYSVAVAKANHAGYTHTHPKVNTIVM